MSKSPIRLHPYDESYQRHRPAKELVLGVSEGDMVAEGVIIDVSPYNMVSEDIVFLVRQGEMINRVSQFKNETETAQDSIKDGPAPTEYQTTQLFSYSENYRGMLRNAFIHPEKPLGLSRNKTQQQPPINQQSKIATLAYTATPKDMKSSIISMITISKSMYQQLTTKSTVTSPSKVEISNIRPVDNLGTHTTQLYHAKISLLRPWEVATKHSGAPSTATERDAAPAQQCADTATPSPTSSQPQSPTSCSPAQPPKESLVNEDIVNELRGKFDILLRQTAQQSELPNTHIEIGEINFTIYSNIEIGGNTKTHLGNTFL